MFAIFTIAVLSFLASVDITSGERKVSRNIPVGTEIKTPANFDCPEEFGYYPHPTDCTQYYVCVFGGALLESCTGGLMYSHELQTCDWPRNVGCDGSDVSNSQSSPSSSSQTSSRGRDREETRTRYTPPPPPPPPVQPSAVVTSRGQPRQLHHNQKEIIKQQQHQQQLYADAEESLPPAEEIESDRQQRVYRGQPSTVGQVERDRDGLRHTNAIQSYSGRSEKIGVISFGTQQQQQQQPTQQHYSEGSSSSASPAAQQPISTVTSAPRNIYNTTQYNNHYDPYYALYDDDVELYRDVEYSHNNNNNNYNNNAQQTHQQTTYRGTPAPAIVQSTSAHEESPKRGNTVYLQNNYSPQDIYQQSTVSDYNEDNSYASQADDQNYRQSSRQPSRLSLRGDRNEINDVEEGTIKRTTTRKPTTTSLLRTTFRTYTAPPLKKITPQLSREPVTAKENQTQAQSIINTIQESPGHVPVAPKYLPDTQNSQNNSLTNRQDIITTTTTTLLPITYRPKLQDTISESTLHAEALRAAILRKPAPFSLPQHITEKTKPAYHYITKTPKTNFNVFNISAKNVNSYVNSNISKGADVINTTQSVLLTFSNQKNRTIVPTTYSPPKFFLKSILPKSILSSTLLDSPIFNFRSANRTSLPPKQLESSYINKPETILNTPYKTLKSVRKLINPITVNHELSTTTDVNYDSLERIVSNEYTSSENFYNNKPSLENKLFINDDDAFAPTTIRYKPTITTAKVTTSTTTKTTTTTATAPTTSAVSHNDENLDDEYIKDQFELNNFKQYHLNNDNDDDDDNVTITNEKRFRTTIEIPPAHELINTAIKQKLEPDQPPSYKLKPYPKPLIPSTKTDIPQNTSFPVRVSRVNAAIKSLIANGGTRRQNSKCNENQTPNTKCNNDPQQRNSARGRGTAHYSGSSGNIVNNEVTVNTNRGTPAPRARPTLKPSTSIVSKASEFIDIYRYPPRRPDPIYPQPQPDKTAAKCRKDVCLLPDCSCGGKEIPGDVPADHVPQIVLLTFDDSVNDLNKGLYSDLFEKGRTNPNGCPIAATFYVSHEWTDYSQVQNLYSDGHEIASHTVSHSFGEQFSQKKWTREVAGQREILSAYGGVHLEDVRGMRAPFLSVGGNKMFKMLYDSNFTYDSSMPIYENKPPSWPYTLDYKLFHDCMIPPCPTRSYPGVWEVPMVMWQDLNGGRCSMGDACSNPPDAEGVFKMLMKNFQRHYTTNRAPFGLFYHAAWFTQPHHKEGFINFIDTILAMKDVWLVTNWQAIQWVRDPTPTSRLGSFQPFQCDFSDRPKRCNNPKVCNLWHKSGVRYMRTCQPCPDIYPWTGNTGIRSSRIDNDIED